MNISYVCTICSIDLGESPFPADFDGKAGQACTLCNHLATMDEAAALNVRTWLDDQLNVLPGLQGFPRRLLRDVDCDGLPDEIWDKIPKEFIDSVYRGAVPEPGLGLIGPSGSRKSGTLVWAAQALHRRIARRLAATCLPDDWGQIRLKASAINIFWIDWPEMYGWLQRHAIYTDQVDDWIRLAIQADVLILDDLGAESLTRRGDDDKSTPFALGRLAEVIRARSADCAATWWTSNLIGKDFKNMYEISLFSRLYELAPPLTVPSSVQNYRLPIVSVPAERH